MKSVTEFASFALEKGLSAKTALAAEGKTAEEIATAIGEAMKYEGDKLKFFINALDVAAQNTEGGLSRVLVVSLNEGENAPPKAAKIEEMHYVPEFKMAPKAVVNKKDLRTDKGKGKGDRKDRPKGSPWGITPEEKAAKKKA